MGGGTLAAGVKPASTREEVLMEEAWLADQYMRRYGWEYAQIDRQPQWLLMRLPRVWAIERELGR